jgi:hypothetical protein
LPDDPNSIEFQTKLAELNRPVKEAVAVAAGLVKALIAVFEKSPEFTQLKTKTRNDYARYLRILGEKWGRCRSAASVASTSRRCVTNMPRSRARRTTWSRWSAC